MATDIKINEELLRMQLEELKQSYSASLLKPKINKQKDARLVFIFSVGGCYYALPAESFSEILPAKDIINIPTSESQIAGAIAHRQEVVTLLDIASIFKTQPQTDKNERWMMILRPKSEQAALLVDELYGLELVNFSANKNQISEEVHHDYIIDSFYLMEKSIALLDVKLLLNCF